MKKILITRTDRIGDLILTTPAIRAVRKYYPEAEIHLLINDYTKDLVLNNPNIDKLLVDGKYALDRDYDPSSGRIESNKQIARIAQTRLRAVILTTLTTVAGVLPTAYGFAGYDAMLAEMMLSLTWGLIFGTAITLLLIPTIYGLGKDIEFKFAKTNNA